MPEDRHLSEDLALRLVEGLRIDTAEDFFAAKEFFELAVSAAPIDGTLPAAPEDLAGFRLAQAGLFHLRAQRKNLTRNGILWRGRPSFITDASLSELRAEFAALRPHAFHDRWGQYLAEGSTAVLRLLESHTLHELIESFVGALGPIQRATCIFYDQVGACIRPHVDTDRFCVNANLLLRHTGEGSQTSKLVVYPIGGEPETVPLAPGELVLFYADCVVHARTPLSSGETVWVISLGYQPAGEFHK